MLGHVLWREARSELDVRATVRSLDGPALVDPGAAIDGVTLEDPDSVGRALDAARPDVVVNCVGVVKQAVAEPATLVRGNALFPHELAALCAQRGVRLIHLSTDCVFSGRRGGYTEADAPDPVDLYGRSKLLGEPTGPHVLTVRTSMIGWELGGRRQGLLEWFAAQRGETVRGFTRAIFSGPTTPVLARALLRLAVDAPDLAGTFHLGADPIDKHTLLLALRDALALDVTIEPDDAVAIDRSLDSTALREATGWSAPNWDEMLAELARDPDLATRTELSGAHR